MHGCRVVDLQDRLSAEELNIAGRAESANAESQNSPMCNRTSVVWSFGPSRNDPKKLTIAIKRVVAVVIAAATMATPPATIRNPEHALDGSHCATDAGPDRAANHTADRAANPVAFRRALLRAAHDALRMPDMGDCEQ